MAEAAGPTTRTVLAAILMVADAAGCRSTDELSADVVASLVRTPGSASGDQWSGSYALELTERVCECTEGSAEQRCVLDTISPAARVLHEDGIILMDLDQGQLSGAIDADGTFAVGHVQTIRLQGLTSDIVVRLDGEFFNQSDEKAFHGALRARVFAHSTETAIDCRDSRWVDGREASPR